MNRVRTILRWSLVALLALIAGCNEALYSNLEEREINEMIAILKLEGVDAKRVSTKEDLYNLEVGESDFAKAVLILSSQGYPRDKYKSIDQLFPSDGIVSTPTEEHARLIFAMNQQLSKTISELPGIANARVHIAQPKQEAYSKIRVPARASVVIQHSNDFDEQTAVSKVKGILSSSVENLSYNNVFVALFPADAIERKFSPQIVSN